jgi:hypothetical protein
MVMCGVLALGGSWVLWNEVGVNDALGRTRFSGWDWKGCTGLKLVIIKSNIGIHSIWVFLASVFVGDL